MTRRRGLRLLGWAVVALAVCRLLWVPLEAVTVAMDEARYLGLAASFPWPTLYGDGLLYLFHPPGYAWAIGALTLLAIPDHLAGVLVSALAAGATCGLVLRLARALGLSRLAGLAGAAALLLHAAWLDSAAAVMREALFGCLAVGLVQACLGEVRSQRRRTWVPGLFALALVVVSDTSILGFGALFVCAAWCRLRIDQRYVARVALWLVVPWALWATIRAVSYGGAEHLPASVDGMIVDTTAWGLPQLYSPYFFPEHQETVVLGARPWTLRAWGFSELLVWRAFGVSLPWWLGAPLWAAALARGAARARVQGNAELALAALALGFSTPTVFHESVLPRFGAPASIFVALLVGQGLATWAGWLRRAQRGLTSARFAAGLAAGVVAVAVGHLAANPRTFLFALPKRVEASAAAARLTELPGEGAVMAQLGYGQELAYLLERPVVALPVYPDRLEEWIADYGVAYVVIGDHYYASPETGDLREVWCAPTIAHVFAHPERFEPVARVEETAIPGWPDTIRIYRVR